MVVYAIARTQPDHRPDSKLQLGKRGYIATDDSLATSIPACSRGHRHRRGDVIEAMARAPRRAAMKATSAARHDRVYRDDPGGRIPAVRYEPGRARLRARATAEVKPWCRHGPEATRRRDPSCRVARRRQADPHARGARRRDHERLGEERRSAGIFGAIAARMGNGVWTVEIIRPRSSRRAQHRRRERHRIASARSASQRGDEARSRSRSTSRCCSDASTRRAETRLHHPARKHVGREPDRRSRPSTEGRATACSPRGTRPRSAHGEGVPCARLRPAQGQEHVRAGMLCNLYSLT